MERVLLCLDEQTDARLQLKQMTGLLRATIQHHRRVRFLVSGTATFDELGAPWTDTFISA